MLLFQPDGKALARVEHEKDPMDIDLLRKSPDLRSIVDIRLMSLEDGPGRGQRLLVARNGVGVGFEVAVDRGFDLSALSMRGTNIGWHSPNQMPFPVTDPDSEGGWAFMRNFDGFMVTCGLDHFGRPEEVDISHYNHPHLQTLTVPQHGRISASRAKLSGYGVDPDTGEIFCEGIVRQASIFSETLELRRRISLPAFGTELTIEDRVINRGFRPARHGVLYHLNFGHPFLDDTFEFIGLPDPLALALAADRPVPDDGYGERVDTIESTLLDGAGVTMRNDRLGLAVRLAFGQSALPKFAIWRAYQSGVFALGLEPKTDRAETMPLVNPGEHCEYQVTLGLVVA